MPINMQQLSAALEPVRRIGTEENTFLVGDTGITLRLTTPKEEVEAQAYARGSLGEGDDEEGERHVIMSYLDHVKVGYLSYAIVRLGDLDLRGAERIETGEALENGKMVSIPKHLALRDLLWSWNRLVLVGLFKKYSELITKTQQAVEDAIEFEPTDLGSEIDRLQERIEELKRLQEESKIDDEATERLLSLAEVDGTEMEMGAAPVEVPEEATDTTQVPEAAPQVPEPVEAPQPPSQEAPRRRTAILPERMAPPAEQAPPSSPPQQARPSVPLAPPTSGSSFVDSSDAEAMQAEANAEHMRIVARRQRAAQGLPPEPAPASVLQTSGMRRVPPHAGAAQAAATVTAAELKHQALEREYAEVGQTPAGVPMFRPPVEELGGPAPTAQPGPPPQQVPINPQPAGNANPRFKRSPGQPKPRR